MTKLYVLIIVPHVEYLQNTFASTLQQQFESKEIKVGVYPDNKIDEINFSELKEANISVYMFNIRSVCMSDDNNGDAICLLSYNKHDLFLNTVNLAQYIHEYTSVRTETYLGNEKDNIVAHVLYNISTAKTFTIEIRKILSLKQLSHVTSAIVGWTLIDNILTP